MRLAQIARKVGLTSTDIKRFLESEFELNIGKEPNYKLDESQVNAVLAKFPLLDEPEIVAADKNKIEPETTETVDAALETEEEEDVIEIIEFEVDAIETFESEESTESEEPEAITEVFTPIDKTESRVEINYDDEGEPINEVPSSFKEVEVNPDAEIIQAPKIKLDGLKVLGKIELPQDKKIEEAEKTEEELKEEEADEIALLDAAMQSQVQDVKAAKVVAPEANATIENTDADEELYSEYKDAKGIYHYSHTQKENRAKALVEIELKQRAIAAKEKKKRHYETLMEAKKSQKVAPINSEDQAAPKPKTKKKVKSEDKPTPKGLWSKFVHWLND